jgi:hypothetical protein
MCLLTDHFIRDFHGFL